MQIIYTPKAMEHLDFWIKSGNKPVLKKIVELTKSVIENPYAGVGKPELSGYWSRRITNEHRFVYKIDGETLIIASLKGHYF